MSGTYCPEGSSEPVGCDPGQYCDADRMYTPQGLCAAGYYCTNNSATATPTGKLLSQSSLVTSLLYLTNTAMQTH